MKCISCGITIPKMPENASYDETKETCDTCGEEMVIVIGDRADCSYGEFLACPSCDF